MPADIQVNTEKYCFLRETCRDSLQLSMPLRQIPAQMISRLQIKEPFVLVLVSEHSQVSEINAAVIRGLWVKRYLASAEQQKQQENLVFVRHFENVPRPILPRLQSGAHCACECHFPCAYATSVNIRYASVYACAYAYVAV